MAVLVNQCLKAPTTTEQSIRESAKKAHGQVSRRQNEVYSTQQQRIHPDQETCFTCVVGSQCGKAVSLSTYVMATSQVIPGTLYSAGELDVHYITKKLQYQQEMKRNKCVSDRIETEAVLSCTRKFDVQTRLHVT